MSGTHLGLDPYQLPWRYSDAILNQAALLVASVSERAAFSSNLNWEATRRGVT